ncbi:LysR family transcriptional regulator [Granulicella cerasi]|uniref:LysR family transcriptional regulator n=1 Tax=Granulicella cerasi TaxID=741063 RepID=A0ABW1Z7F7_9BACT|nr:LysR family transcriptional regulator [Granulicella cerasi]
MSFELRHIRSFIILAEELHFGRAAARLYLAQPALSQQIKQLEDQLGVMLFRRNSHGVALSEEGKLFLPSARAALKALIDGQERLQDRASGVVGNVRVGFISTAALTLLPRLIQQLAKKFPGIELQLCEMNSNEQSNALLRDELDLCFVHADLKHPAIESITVETNTVVLALPSNHALAAEDAVSLKTLARERFILPEKLPHEDFHEIALGICKRFGFAPESPQQVRTLQTAASLVASGAGCALLPSNFVNAKPRGVVFLRLKGVEDKLPLYLAYRKDLKQAIVANVIELAKQLRA